MALAALISATREAREPGVALRATFWLAGRTLLERQARLAASAGAALIIVLVESFPAELAQAVERLRGEGLQVVTARSAAEAAAALSPGMRLMLIADGFVGDRTHVERLLGADRPVLLAVTDRGFDDKFERIDGDTRWAGLAVMDADLLRDTALMPSDWDVQSTLLRRALQTGVRPLPLEDAREAAELGIVERRQDFAELQRRILAGASVGPRNWFSRYALAPIERRATGAIMTSPLTPTMIGSAAAVLTGLAMMAFAFDWRWFGLVPLLLALPLEGIAIRLARLRLQRMPRTAWWRVLTPVLAGAALVALGASLMPQHGWGMLLLAAMAVVFLIALDHEVGGRSVPGERLLANPPSLVILMLPFAVSGWWGAGVAALFAYAAGSFFWAQYHVHAKSRISGGLTLPR
jgi:hypothetical protein